jgi:hypothetical protein
MEMVIRLHKLDLLPPSMFEAADEGPKLPLNAGSSLEKVGRGCCCSGDLGGDSGSCVI